MRSVVTPRADPQPPLPALVRGEGSDIVLLHAFGLGPATYEATATRLADHGRVLVPSWLEVHGGWTERACLDALEATLTWHEVDRYTLVAHSFGGGLGLSLAARNPGRVRDMVLCDTLGLAPMWGLAWNAVQGANFLKLATPEAAIDWIRVSLTHPGNLARAGWWGFRTDREAQIDTVRAAAIRCYLLWAERDTLLARPAGERFAERIGTSLRVVSDPEGGGPVDHNWLYRHPRLAARVLADLGLPADPGAGQEEVAR